MHRFALACLLASFSSAVSAHPGHGVTSSAADQSFWHYASEPVHVLPLVAVVTLTVVAARLLGRRLGKKVSA